MAVGKRETEREWGGVLWCIDCGTTVRDASGCQETKVEEVEAKKEPETESKTEKPKLFLDLGQCPGGPCAYSPPYPVVDM